MSIISIAHISTCHLYVRVWCVMPLCGSSAIWFFMVFFILEIVLKLVAYSPQASTHLTANKSHNRGVSERVRVAALFRRQLEYL